MAWKFNADVFYSTIFDWLNSVSFALKIEPMEILKDIRLRYSSMESCLTFDS